MKKAVFVIALIGLLVGCSSTYSAGLSHYVVPAQQPVVVQDTIIEVGAVTSYRIGPPSPVYYEPRPQTYRWGNYQYELPQYDRPHYYRPYYHNQYSIMFGRGYGRGTN